MITDLSSTDLFNLKRILELRFHTQNPSHDNKIFCSYPVIAKYLKLPMSKVKKLTVKYFKNQTKSNEK